MTDPSTTSRTAAVPDRRASLGEIAVVFGLTVGVMLAGSLTQSPGESNAIAFTDEHLVGVVAYELLLTAFLVPWLSTRGWSPRSLAGTPGPKDLVRGVGLWVATTVLAGVTWQVVSAMRPEIARALATNPRFAGGASAMAVTLVSVLNPVFEEFLWLGYAVPNLTPRLGLRGAAAMSIALRVSVHAYQGPWALPSILPVGLVFTVYYGRTRRLWPVIVAHVILDAVGLAQFLAGRS